MKREDQVSIARALGRAFRALLTEKVKGFVTREELDTRLGRVVAQVGPAGPPGDRGSDGKDGQTPEVAPIIAAVLDKIPPARDGRDGKDGARGEDGLSPEVEPIIAAVLQRVPVPRDGLDGESIKGDKGDPGESIIGPVGPQGIQGDKGRDGESIKGDPGERGKDAEPLDPTLIIQEVTMRLERKVESEVARVASLVPPVRDGKDGKDGKDASAVSRELLLEMVTGEVNRFVATIPIPKDGRDGRDAREPVDGRDGSPGRDASEIDVVESVDESRKYPKGTFGVRADGLCRSTGDGWIPVFPPPSVLVDIQVEKVERVTTHRHIFSDGKEIVRQTKSDDMIYRGIHVAGKEYEKYDVVTRSGSMWICEALKTKAEPGKSTDWRLVVKQGADGKTPKDGEPGPQGPAGRDLRYK